MKVGLFLNTQFPEGDSLAARMPELVEQVRLARRSGFASLWFPDHYLIGPVQMPQPMPLMAWLLRDGEVVHFVHRHMIEGRSPQLIAGELTKAFDKYYGVAV